MSGVLEIVSAGGGCSLQDPGRPGWKRFGVPEGGTMDRESASDANRLVGNAPGAPVLEVCLSGARFRVLGGAEFAIAGADGAGSHPRWRSFFAQDGEEIAFGRTHGGVWSYLAVRGGFTGPRWFGSASVNPRAGFGQTGRVGDILHANRAVPACGVAGRFLREEDRKSFSETPVLPVWPGPEWDVFSADDRARFCGKPWMVSRQCDRSGYRLEGPVLDGPGISLPSSPAGVGVIQVPPAGQPIVLLRDGPTVGGYPRLGILEPAGVSRFAQCAPGTQVRFRMVS